MTFAGIAVLIRFEQFRVFFIIHLVNFRSVRIAQKSGKIQGIFQLLMSGNPVNTKSFSGVVGPICVNQF